MFESLKDLCKVVNSILLSKFECFRGVFFGHLCSCGVFFFFTFVCFSVCTFICMLEDLFLCVYASFCTSVCSVLCLFACFYVCLYIRFYSTVLSLEIRKIAVKAKFIGKVLPTLKCLYVTYTRGHVCPP